MVFLKKILMNEFSSNFISIISFENLSLKFIDCNVSKIMIFSIFSSQFYLVKVISSTDSVRPVFHLHFPDVIYSIDQHYPGSQEHLFLSLATLLLAISLVIYSLIYACMNVYIFSSSLLIKLNLANVKYDQKLSNLYKRQVVELLQYLYF